MKIDGREFELEMIQPRNTKTGDNFVVLVGCAHDSKDNYDRCKIKLTSTELDLIIDKLAALCTITAKY